MQSINTGICSYGMSGKLFHAPFIESHPGYNLSAIVERHKDESRERYPNSRLYRSVEEMLEDESIKLIIVNTPTQLHFSQVRAALLAGKHVVVEKPFAIDASEATQLDKLAAETGLFLSVYQNRRYDGDYREVKKVIESGWLGQVREAEIRYDRYRPGYSGKQHKEGELRGAGILHDLGPHMIDQALQIFGWPEAVFADIRVLRSGDVKANDYIEILLYYPGTRVRIKSTVIARESTYAYIIHGMNGSFLQQRSDLQEQQLLAGVVPTLAPWCPAPTTLDGILHTEIDGEVVRKETRSEPGNYMDYYEAVYQSLANGAPNPVPASDAVLTMTIIDRAVESMTEQRVVPC